LVRFWFCKLKIEKFKPNLHRKKLEKNKSNLAETEPNRKKLSQIKKTEPTWFESVFVLKNRTEQKLIGMN